MYAFSKSSKEKIAEVHPLLQYLAFETIKTSPFDFGIIENGGLRTAEEQKKLYDKGFSKCDGTINKSYHQSGRAIDFVPFINGSFTWDNEKAFLAIAKTVFDVWSKLDDKQGYFLHWGGFWSAKDLNFNGVLDSNDKLGWDMPHYELRTKPQEKGVYPVDWSI